MSRLHFPFRAVLIISGATAVVSTATREWSDSAQGAGIRHLGPMAQDFRAAFNLGTESVWIDRVYQTTGRGARRHVVFDRNDGSQVTVTYRRDRYGNVWNGVARRFRSRPHRAWPKPAQCRQHASTNGLGWESLPAQSACSRRSSNWAASRARKARTKGIEHSGCSGSTVPLADPALEIPGDDETHGGSEDPRPTGRSAGEPRQPNVNPPDAYAQVEREDGNTHVPEGHKHAPRAHCIGGRRRLTGRLQGT
jgi:hypothetical protein